MGPWGKLTTWKWHWSEFRFETYFISPEIVLGNAPQLNKATASKDIKKTTKTTGRALIEINDPGLQEYIWIPACARAYENWNAFLAEIRRCAIEQSVRIGHQTQELSTSWPYLSLRQRSWDSMPFDVTRPIATSNLHDIAVLACRMGMTWKSFAPEQGQLHAEGGPHVLSSVQIRGLGLALDYRYVGDSSVDVGHRRATRVTSHRPRKPRSDRQRDSLALARCNQVPAWAAEADMFAFGICPGNSDLDLPDLTIRTIDDVKRVWDTDLELSTYEECKAHLHSLDSATWWRYSTNELLALTAPMLRTRSSSMALLPIPGYWASIFSLDVFRQVFPIRLAALINGSKSRRLEQVLAEAQYLADGPLMGALPENETAELRIFLDRAQDSYDESTRYFLDLQETHENFYFDLLRAHLSQAPILTARAMAREKKSAPRDQHLNTDAYHWRSEHVHLMFDAVPQYISFMRAIGYNDLYMIEEAWIVLALRGMCWGICHEGGGIKGDFLPTKYYGSQIPVFLT